MKFDEFLQAVKSDQWTFLTFSENRPQFESDDRSALEELINALKESNKLNTIELKETPTIWLELILKAMRKSEKKFTLALNNISHQEAQCIRGELDDNSYRLRIESLILTNVDKTAIATLFHKPDQSLPYLQTITLEKMEIEALDTLIKNFPRSMKNLIATNSIDDKKYTFIEESLAERKKNNLSVPTLSRTNIAPRYTDMPPLEEIPETKPKKPKQSTARFHQNPPMETEPAKKSEPDKKHKP